MSTSTFSFWASALTSTISPSKSESGPEVTFTDSPSENSTCARCRSPIAVPVRRIRSTSGCESGTGVLPAPTKPVTPGVFLTTPHESFEDQVGDPRIRADDRARDDYDDRALDDLVLGRPLDLLQLGPGLGDEAPEAAAGDSA